MKSHRLPPSAHVTVTVYVLRSTRTAMDLFIKRKYAGTFAPSRSEFVEKALLWYMEMDEAPK